MSPMRKLHILAQGKGPCASTRPLAVPCHSHPAVAVSAHTTLILEALRPGCSAQLAHPAVERSICSRVTVHQRQGQGLYTRPRAGQAQGPWCQGAA